MYDMVHQLVTDADLTLCLVRGPSMGGEPAYNRPITGL